jgi:predicted transcriptional regulator YheO
MEDDRDNWGLWAATIDAKIDAVVEQMKDHPREPEWGGVLMENVDERIENALRDYKREIHQHLSRAMSNVEEMHMQAISKMQEVSEKYIHELHDKHVQAVVLNQNLDAMNDMDELQQKLHEKFHMERQNMLNEVDQRLQMHGQK